MVRSFIRLFRETGINNNYRLIEFDNMLTSFVLIKTKPGKGCEVCDEFIKMPEIKECFRLSGEYDILTKINSDNFDEMGQIIREKIRFIHDVIDTKTLLGLKF